MFNVTVTQQIKPERIADMMISAIENNHMTRSWCAGVFLKSASAKPTPGENLWYADPATYSEDFQIVVDEIIDEGKPIGPGNIEHHVCGRAEFEKGLHLMATMQSSDGTGLLSHFQDMIDENDDCVTADVFLQCIALGEIRYG